MLRPINNHLPNFNKKENAMTTKQQNNNDPQNKSNFNKTMVQAIDLIKANLTAARAWFKFIGKNNSR